MFPGLPTNLPRRFFFSFRVSRGSMFNGLGEMMEDRTYQHLLEGAV